MMKKAFILGSAAFLCLAIATGCTTLEAETAPSPLETAMPSASMEAPLNTPDASQAAQAEVYRLVGKEATIQVADAKVKGGAFYAGEGDDTMVFPLAEVAKALGWEVSEPADASGKTEINLTRDDEKVSIAYQKPNVNNVGTIAGVMVTKGGQPVSLGDEPIPHIDGMLYVTEAFLDKVLQEVTVAYDGALSITISAKA